MARNSGFKVFLWSVLGSLASIFVIGAFTNIGRDDDKKKEENSTSTPSVEESVDGDLLTVDDFPDVPDGSTVYKIDKTEKMYDLYMVESSSVTSFSDLAEAQGSSVAYVEVENITAVESPILFQGETAAVTFYVDSSDDLYAYMGEDSGWVDGNTLFNGEYKGCVASIPTAESEEGAYLYAAETDVLSYGVVNADGNAEIYEYREVETASVIHASGASYEDLLVGSGKLYFGVKVVDSVSDIWDVRYIYVLKDNADIMIIHDERGFWGVDVDLVDLTIEFKTEMSWVKVENEASIKMDRSAYNWVHAATLSVVDGEIELSSSKAFVGDLVIPEYVTRINWHFEELASPMTIYIPTSVKYIDSYVRDCDNLLFVYEGTVEQWKSIEKGTNTIDSAHIVEVQCTDGTVAHNAVAETAE